MFAKLTNTIKEKRSERASVIPQIEHLLWGWSHQYTENDSPHFASNEANEAKNTKVSYLICLIRFI